MSPPAPRSLNNLVAQICLLAVIAISVARIFVASPALSAAAAVSLVLYFALTWRQFTVATWVPIVLSGVLLVIAGVRGIDTATLTEAVDRMAFLSSLLALLGILRVVASDAPEIAHAGRFLTAQPPGRRYLAMNFGGHVFGLLINLGGLALLLEMARGSLDRPGVQLTQRQRDWKLRRMTVATLRGFVLIPMWSPFGFGMNALLLAMPGLTYAQVGPRGLGLSLLFLLWGWFLDWLTGPRVAPGTLQPPPVEPSDRTGVLILIGHVILLGGLVFLLHLAIGWDFQQALLIAVPGYSLIWAARTGRHQPGGSGGAMRRTVAGTIRRFPLAAGEIGVFASAGLLSVLALELIPLDRVQALVVGLGMAAWQMVVLLNLSLFGLATLGINPIISASVMGSVVAQLHLPGLSLPAAALSLAGAWSCVMGFTPFITTVAYAGALIGRSPTTVGLRWNGLYCLSSLAMWTAGVALAVGLGVI